MATTNSRVATLARACAKAEAAFQRASSAETRAREHKQRTVERYLRAISKQVVSLLKTLEWKPCYDRDKVAAEIPRSHELAQLLSPVSFYYRSFRIGKKGDLAVRVDEFPKGAFRLRIDKFKAKTLGWYAPLAATNRETWSHVRQLLKQGALKTKDGVARVQALIEQLKGR
jgi:hypothetical protein